VFFRAKRSVCSGVKELEKTYRVLSPTLKSCESGKLKEYWSEDLERVRAIAIDFHKRHSITAENIVIKKEGTPSLDTNTHISTWNKKLKRVFSCTITGLNRAQALGKTSFFLTLTTSKECRSDIGHDWDLLVKRVRREMGFDFQYMKVETSEGNGVVHALFHDAFSEKDFFEVSVLNEKTGVFEKTNKTFDAIHAYFSCLWNELHKSPIVWCSVVGSTRFWSKKLGKFIYMDKKRVARYICQYTARQQGFLRRSSSVNWIFKGWRKRFLKVIVDFGFVCGIQRWRNMISNPDYNPVSNPNEFQFPIGI